MTISSFIAAKRDGKVHSKEDIDWFISELVAGKIPDYQTSAWLMAAYLQSFSKEEAVNLTWAMARSGETLTLDGMPRPVVDKHSTGGVGDATTLLFLPIMAACGMPVVKMSGKGLGFTGGTIDKLAAIPGFRTDLSPKELVEIANDVGCALGGQTAELAPADKILYSLRDATGTIGNTTLIASSVMSKKLAAGADIIVLDVKAGNGAFAKTPDQGRSLAAKLVAIGQGAGKKVRAIVSDMSQPLAPAVGNAIEVRAAIRELKNGCKGRLGRLTVQLCDTALELAGKSPNAQTVVDSGKAQSKMEEWFSAQGGDARVVSDESLLPVAERFAGVAAMANGFVSHIDTEGIGECARMLGAGRLKKDDAIDISVGIEICKQLGDPISIGDEMFVVHALDFDAGKAAANELLQCFDISEMPVEKPPLVHAVVG